MSIFEGDILLFQIVDGGEINVEGGQPEMTGGFETMVYLSLFGGNADDDGSVDNPLTWWGNVDEPDPQKRYISETQNLLLGLPATPSNLRRVEEAAKRDLERDFIETGIASSVEVSASIPDVDKINISGSITAEGVETSFNFIENWRSMQNGS